MVRFMKLWATIFVTMSFNFSLYAADYQSPVASLLHEPSPYQERCEAAISLSKTPLLTWDIALWCPILQTEQAIRCFELSVSNFSPSEMNTVMRLCRHFSDDEQVQQLEAIRRQYNKRETNHEYRPLIPVEVLSSILGSN